LKDSAVSSSFRLSCTNRFAKLAVSSSDHKQQYTSFVASVATAAECDIPVIKRTKRKVSWEDVTVQTARAALSTAKATNRRHRSADTLSAVATASLALARQYTTNQEKYIEEQLQNIRLADESRKPTEVWKVISNLTGRKSKPVAKVKPDSPEARISGWQCHFEKLLNNDVTPTDNFVARFVTKTLEDIPTGEILFKECLAASKQLKTGNHAVLTAYLLRSSETRNYFVCFIPSSTQSTPPASLHLSFC
jgi:hypothetical protein